MLLNWSKRAEEKKQDQSTWEWANHNEMGLQHSLDAKTKPHTSVFKKALKNLTYLTRKQNQKLEVSQDWNLIFYKLRGAGWRFWWIGTKLNSYLWTLGIYVTFVKRSYLKLLSSIISGRKRNLNFLFWKWSYLVSDYKITLFYWLLVF